MSWQVCKQSAQRFLLVAIPNEAKTALRAAVSLIDNSQGYHPLKQALCLCPDPLSGKVEAIYFSSTIYFSI